MSDHRLVRSQVVPRELDDVFAFFARARNLEALTPPWLRFQMLGPEPEMAVGTRIDYRLRVRGVPIRWASLIEEWSPGASFVDRQLHGPYARWLHRHTFEPHSGGTLVGDDISYALPLGPLGSLAHAVLVRRDLERIFDHRHATVDRLLAATS